MTAQNVVRRHCCQEHGKGGALLGQPVELRLQFDAARRQLLRLTTQLRNLALSGFLPGRLADEFSSAGAEFGLTGECCGLPSPVGEDRVVGVAVPADPRKQPLDSLPLRTRRSKTGQHLGQRPVFEGGRSVLSTVSRDALI